MTRRFSDPGIYCVVCLSVLGARRIDKAVKAVNEALTQRSAGWLGPLGSWPGGAVPQLKNESGMRRCSADPNSEF